MIDLDDDRLAVVLADVGRHLATESVVHLVRHRRRSQSVALVALAAAAAVITVVVAVAPLRSAVADWLGIGSTRIRIEPSPPTTVAPIGSIGSIGSIDDDLARIDLAGAELITGASLTYLDGTELGAPAGYARMPEGGALVLWADGTTLWIHIETIDPEVYFDKLVASDTMVRRVDDLGDSAMVIVGDHFLQTPHRIVAATTAVLWRSGDVEYRLESDRESATLIALARELAAAS